MRWKLYIGVGRSKLNCKAALQATWRMLHTADCSTILLCWINPTCAAMTILCLQSRFTEGHYYLHHRLWLVASPLQSMVSTRKDVLVCIGQELSILINRTSLSLRLWKERCFTQNVMLVFIWGERLYDVKQQWCHDRLPVKQVSYGCSCVVVVKWCK